VPLVVALVSDVFPSPETQDRLTARLADARRLGADLAVLPELPLNGWSPATAEARDEDAEPAGGRRHHALARAAAGAGIGVIGGAIVRDERTGERRNTTLVFDARGALVARYAKVHLPDEDGFREPAHYAPGTENAEVVEAFGMPIGIQVCSDINRPVGAQILAAMGAEAIINPRATEAATFDRWKLTFRAVALTTSSYVLSVNRPRPENGVALGGPSIVVGPDGVVVAESIAPLVVTPLDGQVVAAARRSYPGYLPHFAAVYARGWQAVAARSR
jgi:predicted amidohydrolase